ncbi:unnamed protein product [Scytosiphon promiscuus]
MSPASAFNGAIASVVGAILIGGGTLSLSPQVVDASPFDPRPPPKSARQPFFEGWFIRLVDHEQRLSFAVIIGSFRGRGEEELDQHYVSLSYLHEPIGGLLPAEVEREGGQETQDATQGADAASKGGGGIVDESLQARSSEIAKRFSRWIREQRLAVLRGFGVEEEEEGWEGEEKAERKTPGSPGGLRKGGVGVGPAQGKEDQKEVFKGSDEAKTAGGSRDDSDASIDREADAARLLDPVSEEQDEGATQTKVEDSDAGLASDGEENPTDTESFEEEIGIDRPEDEYWFGEGGDGELVKAARKPGTSMFPTLLDASDSEETAREVKAGRREQGALGDEAIEAAAKKAPLGRMETGGIGDTADEMFVKPSSPPPKPSLRAPSRADPSWDYFAAHENSTERTHTFHAFPPADTVTITRRGEPVDSVPNLQDDPNFTWEADGIGSFMVDGDTGRLSFQLPELSVAASFRHRKPWSEDHPNSAGPEGWLQRTGLLPLHYFVHSMGSEAGYSLKATDAPRAVVGRGSIHMEANYGESFPAGWVWAQGSSATEGLCGNVFRDGEMTGGSRESTEDKSREQNAVKDKSHDLHSGVGCAGGGSTVPARFVLTGGRFVIGPITTTSFVVAFRSERYDWNFRTTDLDSIVVTASRKKNRLTLVAKSWGDSRVLKADIHVKGSFGSAIYVPTPEGFSNTPGCVESYAATARFRLYTKGDKVEGDGLTRPLVLREEVEIKASLAALEFGGEYQDT